jgi:hypothetical protein
MLIRTEYYQDCELHLYREGPLHYYTISIAGRRPIPLPRTMNHTTVEAAQAEARSIVDARRKRKRMGLGDATLTQC